ncbi:hypothetical protein Tco_0272220 [Tanacetum coccineum]
MMALTGVEQDDWSIEFDAEHMHFGQDGLDDFDWSNKADDGPYLYLFILMASKHIEEIGPTKSDLSPPTGTIIPPRANVSFTGIDELAIRNKVVNQEKTKSSQSAIDRNKVIIEDWVDSDDEETDVSESQKETASLTQRIGSRETRPVWNNIQRVNHSNFSRNSRYPHQRRSFTPSAVLTRDGLISTARPKMTQTVPSKSTANVTYQGTARSRVPQAVLSRSTDGSYYPRMDNRRPRILSYSPSSRSSTTRTPHRPQRPKKVVKLIWVKKGSTVGSQAVLPQTVKKAMIRSITNKGNQRELSDSGMWQSRRNLRTMLALTWMLWKYDRNKDNCLIIKEFKAMWKKLKLILISVSQICDKKHNVLFTDKECLILSPKFKFVDEDLATEDEAVLWHRRLGHDNSQKYSTSCKRQSVRVYLQRHARLDHSVWHLKGKESRENIAFAMELPTSKMVVLQKERKDYLLKLARTMSNEWLSHVHLTTAFKTRHMFAVCLCARYPSHSKRFSHLQWLSKDLVGISNINLIWVKLYPKDSPFHVGTFSDSDYAGDNHDRRSTSGGCQYLGRRLVSWQCKKQTIVAISSTEAEYVAAASCCAQVLWMQNQLLDYGFNFMNTEIHIDNESTICIVKNPVFHSKTKHIQIRHHFIRDCYEQRLINVVKVHTDDNVADLLTKGFDLARFKFLVVTIGMMNP